MKTHKIPAEEEEVEEEGDDPYHQQQQLTNNNPSFLDQTPSSVSSALLLESTSTSNIAANFSTRVFEMLSNVKLHATLPPRPPPPPPPDSHDDNPVILLVHERGESSEQKKPKSNFPPPITHGDDAEKRRRDSDSNTRSRRNVVRPKRCRSTELHNLAERTRRDRIRRRMKALQDLIPNCNTRDKASMLDDAIKHIKSLQSQLEIMSSMIQTVNVLPTAAAGYQIIQMPQFNQFIGMNPAAGMGMYNFPTSSSVPFMPFPFPGPAALVAASGLNMNFGQMNQLEMPESVDPLRSAPWASTYANWMVPPPESLTYFPATISSSHGESTSSQSVPGSSNLSQTPQGLASVTVLPTQIITPAASSTGTNLVTDFPGIPAEEDDDDSDPSQRI